MLKKTFLKRASAVIILLIAVLSLASCSGNNSTSSSQTSTVSSSVSGTESKDSSVPSESSGAKEKVFDISGKDVNKNIIGLWEEINTPNMTYTFNVDNTLIISKNDNVLKKLYYTDNGKLYTSPDEYTEPEIYSYSFDNDNSDMLTLVEEEGTSLKFRRSF